jgi:dihydrofolate reductase
MIGAIFAIDEANGFGLNSELPWAHISEDFKHFKHVTNGGTIVMGKNTFESLPSLLPNRTHVVLSSTLPPGPGYYVYDDPSKLIEATGNNFWVIGGPSVIEIFHNLVGYDVIYQSVINGKHTADVIYDPSEMLDCMEYSERRVYDKFCVRKYVHPDKF